MLKACLILAVFLVCVGLIVARKLPTVIALPIMAIAIPLVAGIPFFSTDAEQFTIAKDILENGAMRLSSAIAGLFFCAWFGQVLNRVGITQTMIRKAAELAGDKPLAIAIAFLVVTSLIISAANGLGMVILVGTIIVPIMISAGIEPLTAGMVLLLGNTVGTVFCPSTQAMYTDALGLSLTEVTQWSWLQAVGIIPIALIMVIYYVGIRGKKRVRKSWAMPQNEMASQKNVRTIALISPLIPIVLIFVFKLQSTPAIMIGIVIALILSTPKNVIQVVSGGFVEGIQSIAGAAALMVGIGMVLNAVMAPQVYEVLQPLILLIMPTGPVMYVLVFGLLSFLALYRGPLNTWGLGSGIMALMASSGMSPIAAMVALRIISNVGSLSDPTNSHAVWIADFTKLDVNDYLKRTIIWVMAGTLLGLFVAAFILF